MPEPDPEGPVPPGLAWLFRICVVLDLLVLFVVTGILVGALGAALFKAIFGVI